MKYHNFFPRMLRGEFDAAQIDDAVDEWHESDDDMSLREFLGMTEYEYALMVTNGFYWLASHCP